MARRQVLFPRWIGTLLALVVAICSTLAGTTAVTAAAATVTLVPERLVGFPGHAGLYGWGAATMRDGSVLIGDYWNQRVLHYATDGSFLGVFIQNVGYKPDQHQSPYGLAVDPDTGDVYMADTDRRQVDRYSETGVFLNSFGQSGKSGTAPGMFKYPSRMAVRNGLVFVSDTWANRIVVYTPTGTVEEWSFGSSGSAPGQFKQPRAIDFDQNGLLYVANQGNKRIDVFSVDEPNETLIYVRQVGSKYNGAIASPPGDAVIRGDLRGLAVDKVNDVLYLMDAESNKVHKFATDGTYLSSFGSKGNGPGEFWDGGREITIDGLGRIWVGDMPNFRVQVFDADGNFVLMRPDPPEPPADGGFNGPRGVAVDAAGNFFVVDTYNQRVEKLAPDGSFITGWGQRGRDEYSFNYPRTIAVDPTDQSVVLVDTDNGRLKSYTNDGTFQWESGSTGTALGQFKNPHGIDAGADGRIYVADTNNSRVQVLDHLGTPLYSFGSNGNAPGQFKRPRGLVVDDSDGHIFVTDATRDIVQEFANDGTYLRSISGPGSTPDKLRQPFDVEVNGAHIFVSDTIDNSVKVFSKATGIFVDAFGGGGKKLGNLRDPQGMDLVAGHLYVAERFNDRITDFSVVSDTAPPTVTIDVPTPPLPAGSATLTGTAFDDAIVAGVAVQIEDPNTSLWWQADNSWGPGPADLAATLESPGAATSNWTYTWPGPAGSYVAHAIATDGVGNVSPPAAQAFDAVADVAEPDTTITDPANNEALPGLPVDIAGTVVDDLAVQRVEIAIKDRNTNLWWNQTTQTWGSFTWNEASVDSPGGTASGWTFSFDDSSNLGTGSYYAQGRGIDAAGTIESTRSQVKFTV